LVVPVQDQAIIMIASLNALMLSPDHLGHMT
jgi:hypothetical protein